MTAPELIKLRETVRKMSDKDMETLADPVRHAALEARAKDEAARDLLWQDFSSHSKN